LERDVRGRSSGSRIDLLAAPSRAIAVISLREMESHVERESYYGSSGYAAVVPGYSGGTATELHRFPYSFRQATSPAKHLVSARKCSRATVRVKQVETLWKPTCSCGAKDLRQWSRDAKDAQKMRENLRIGSSGLAAEATLIHATSGFYFMSSNCLLN
jgi:hypothetical protein